MTTRSTTSSAALGLVLAAALSLLVGCAGADAAPAATPSATTTTPAAPDPEAVKQDVLSDYATYYENLFMAQRDTRRMQAFLSAVAVGTELDTTSGRLRAEAAQGVESFGSPEVKPVVVQVDGDTATIHDCQDASMVGTRTVETREVLTAGGNPQSATVTMTLVGSTWKVSSLVLAQPPTLYC